MAVKKWVVGEFITNQLFSTKLVAVHQIIWFMCSQFLQFTDALVLSVTARRARYPELMINPVGICHSIDVLIRHHQGTIQSRMLAAWLQNNPNAALWIVVGRILCSLISRSSNPTQPSVHSKIQLKSKKWLFIMSDYGVTHLTYKWWSIFLCLCLMKVNYIPTLH